MRQPLLILLCALLAVGSIARAADDAPIPAAKKNHWAWKAPTLPAVPAVRDTSWPLNLIDHFILAKLENAGRTPAAPASREQLLRRVTFDLIGLPPTPAEIDAFVADTSPDAWLKVVDRLLASPHYGERWGRHWLDVARFAESNGYEFDEVRPDAWRYRDYVIRSFNDDKPYDRFILEQLAGDELFPEQSDALIATGFNLLGADMTDSADQPQRRQNTLNDMTDTAGLAFLGLTVACARCHDHKFEPIPQSDYYRLQAFFTPATFRRDLPLSSKEARAAHEKEVKEGRKPAPLPVAMGLQDNRGALPKTFLLERGELGQPGEEVQPGFPIALLPDNRPTAAKIVPPREGTSGRRSALARWVASPDNALTARVMVNRLWQHHFGRGLVATPNDFGIRGEEPTHPELLDWLAKEFVRSGWSIKHMHRLMLTSATYRQSKGRQRLEGEIIRDQLLAVSGRLNPAFGGPGVFPPVPKEAVQGAKGWTASPDARDHVRRSVYIFARRNLRFPFLEAFDLPDSNLSCPKRERSTTAPQALALLNAPDVLEAAKALAERIRHEAQSDEERVVCAYRLTLGRRPTATERKLACDFLKESPLSELCRALFNTNEFVYLD
jgi:hypothetical protein